MEVFSVAKYFNLVRESLITLQYCHKQGIVLSGVTPHEILVDKQSQRVRFRSFLYSSVLTKGN